jgi:kumamolisin
MLKPKFNLKSVVRPNLIVSLLCYMLLSGFIGIFQASPLAQADSPTPIASPTLLDAKTDAASKLSNQEKLPQHGTKLGATASGQVLHLSVGLKIQDQANLEQFLNDLYNPQSANYKQFLTPHQFTTRFMDASARQQVVAYLKASGLQVNDNGLGSVIEADATVAQAQSLFKVHIDNYQDTATGRLFYANDVTPALPTALASKIEGVFGLESFTQYHAHNIVQPDTKVQPRSNPGNPQGCAGAVGAANTYAAYTPNQFKTAYNFDPFYSAGLSGAGQKIALYELDDYADSNVSTYQTCFGTSVPVTRNQLTSYGTITLGSGQTEVELDIDVVVSMAPALTNLIVYEAKNGTAGVLGEYQQIANDNSAQIISSSWGGCEPTQSSAGIMSENTIFQQMAAQGQSLYIAAGDDGSEGCLRANGSTALAVSDTATSPYATSVGGTKLLVDGSNGYSSEAVWNEFSISGGAGGGGISQFWSKPNYQSGAGTKNSYSNGKRQVPDVSADADPQTGYVIYTLGNWTAIGGTSAATPLWAAATALTNQYLLGQTTPAPVLGFANPYVYRILRSGNYSSVFHDVTIGDNCYNASCGTPNSGSATYPATTAYDQASGVGTFNAYNFAQAVYTNTNTTITGSSINPALSGQSITFTANVTARTGTPTGTVTFTDTTTSTSLGSAPLSAGVATFTTSALMTPGTHLIVASYSGDSNYVSNVSPSYSQFISYIVSGACDEAALDAALAIGGYINFNCPNPTTITVSAANLATYRTITKDTTLEGYDQNITISGAGATQLFQVSGNANFAVRNLTLTSGKESTNGGGGAIFNSGNLTIYNSSILNNSSTLIGGAIYQPNGTLNIVNSTFSSNSITAGISKGYGGALSIGGGSATISNTTFDSNNVVGTTTYAFGGALEIEGGTININNSTFTNNTANVGNTNASTLAEGGAVAILVSSIPATVILNVSGSTFANNVASGSSQNTGGAFSIRTGTVNFTNSTIASNAAKFGAGIMGWAGTDSFLNTDVANNNSGSSQYGIYQFGGAISLKNSTLANNRIADTVGSFTSQDYNLIKTVGSATFSGATTHNITGVDPALAAVLANNGGYTKTLLPQASSPVIDAIPSASPNCPASGVDQRGFARPALNSPTPGNCDIGAVEAQYNSITNLAKNSGDGQSALTNLIYYAPLQVLVTDNTGQPASNVSVSFNIIAGTGGSSATFPGSVTTATVLTDGSGIGTSPSLTANSTAGTFTVQATVNTAAVNGPRVPISVTFNLTNSGPSGINGHNYTYYLPFVANNANGYTSYLSIQNMGNTPASIAAQYFSADGNSLTSNTASASCTTVAVNASCNADNPFASGTKGTGILTSNQPLNILVTESTVYGGSAYAISSGASAELIAPLAINKANGGFQTQLTIFNTSVNATPVTVSFYDQNGNNLPSATQNLNIAAHSSQTLDQAANTSNLPVGFYGWARIEGASGSTLVAQVLEQRADIGFVALANAQAVNLNSNGSKLFAPAIFHNAFGYFVTGANIVNPNNKPVQVSITYYDNSGKAYPASPFSLAANAVAPIYHGASSGLGLPAGGLPESFYGSAVVTSVDGAVVMVVNEAAPATTIAESGTYAAATTGSSNVGLPIVANNGGAGFTTGATVLNTTDTTINATITYYNADGSATGVTKTFAIAAHASQPLYQGAAGLETGFYGQAIIIADSNSLVVTTNALNASMFYTYVE